MKTLSTGRLKAILGSPYIIAFYICAISMTIITMYGLYVTVIEYNNTGEIIIGKVLVDTEFPFKGFAKLITYLMIFSVLTWYCVIKLGAQKVKDVPRSIKPVLQLVLIVLALVALYEFVYNFMVWSSLITVNVIKGVMKVDDISLPYPNEDTPWNLVFATKMSLAAFLIASHGFYTISKEGNKSNIAGNTIH